MDFKTKFSLGEAVQYKSAKGNIKQGTIEKISISSMRIKGKDGKPDRENTFIDYFLFGVYKKFNEGDLKRP